MMGPKHKIPLALTMGEPAGIGPELIAQLWADREILDLAPFLYIGAPEAIQAVMPTTPVEIISDVDEVDHVFDRALPCLPTELSEQIQPGIPNSKNADSVIDAIRLAVDQALKKKISGIVTAPINKSVLYQAGFDTPGHTEFLSRLCGKKDEAAVMMLTAKNLRVVPVTVHVPIKDVAKQLTADKIFHAGMTLHHDLKYRFSIEAPKIAVAGLNPHAGEGGAIGFEEATHIMPAIWKLRDHGIDVGDPAPADTLFHAEARDRYDAVLCMYHDQALIPVKTVDFWGGVNVTLGLPILRTSPDHGTACELAGTGLARIDSMVAAVKLAQKIAQVESAKS